MIRYTTDKRIQQFSKVINYYSGANLNTIKKLITILPCEEVSFIVMILTCCTIELGPIYTGALYKSCPQISGVLLKVFELICDMMSGLYGY